MIDLAAFVVLTYLFAALPFGLVLTTLYGGDVDIRASGSGNIGATNVARVYGWKLAAWVLALDMSKGLLPVLVAGWMWPELGVGLQGVVALVAFIGHCWPIYLELRGGKGVATGAGAMLALVPVPTLIAAALWGGLLAVTGRSSVAALGATISLVLLCLALSPGELPVVVLLGVGLVYRHLPNIQRLVSGDEAAVIRRVSWGRGRSAGEQESDFDALLNQGPAGETATAPTAWRGADDVDPLDTPTDAGLDVQIDPDRDVSST